MQNAGVANEQRQRRFGLCFGRAIFDLRKYCAARVIVQA
jgi:hypothetical protein